ncbi:tail tape measure protein [Cellulophaga phage Nekkels_1]|uniref:Tail tape measure protein n=1 Tax=Cellulophaga phage Nekkels_1 TaxID=2745692 RepID=A0A8E4XZM4_9CAUD|nr:tail tape measure protein [Cellulophaga phage Nekkels_1]QQO97050.1 tail tape measure protein [Cellulophaga phage Nekkels_1]QQO97143.1 tail tape measure protein [Cellulophaga phage Nekkels_2]
MANNGIITGDQVLKGVREEIKAVDADFKELLKTFNTVAAALTKTTSASGIESTIKQVNGLSEKQIALSTKLARLKKEESNAIAAEQRANAAGARTTEISARAKAKTVAATTALIRAENALAAAKKKSLATGSSNLAQFQSLNNAYNQQSRLLNSLRDRYKSLAIQQLQGNTLTKAQVSEYKKLGSQIKILDSQLKKVDATAGQFQRNVGNYPKVLGSATRGLRSFLGAFGLTSGIYLFANALKSTFKIFKDFDQGQADLAGILGIEKSDTRLINLTNQAKLLGATTAFTATQVSELQLELAKLGFNDAEIIKATRGVENLAIATGVDAARAAKLAGAAIRGFNLDASEANRVASALAVSTTKSASSFETLETSLPKVSAIAKSFGFTIEDTTALLGGLQNAGFEASIAGTSLRQIFLQLADSNGKLAQRLGGGAESFDELIEQFKKVEEEGISLGEAFNLTNARSVAAFKVFLSGADDLKKLRDSITDVEGELDKLAETKLDSLTGDVTLLTSAWEGLVLSIEDGEGEISKFFRTATQGLTTFLTGLREINETGVEQGVQAARSVVESFKNSTEITQGEVKNFLVKTIKEADSNIEVLIDRYEELKNQGTIGELFTRNYFEKLEEARKALEKEQSARSELGRILLEEANQKEDLAARTAKLAVLAGAEKGNEINLENQLIEFRKLTIDQLKVINSEYADFLKKLTETGANKDAENSLNTLRLQLKALQEEFNNADYNSDDFKRLKDEISGLEALIARLEGRGGGKIQKKIIEGSVEAYNDLISKLKELRDGTATTTEEWKKFDDQIAQTERSIRLLTEGADALTKVEGFEPSYSAQDFTQGLGYKDPAEVQRGITNKIAEEKEKERAILKSINDGILTDYEGFTNEETNILTEALQAQRDLRINQEQAVGDLIVGSLDTIFQARIDNIDKEIDANQYKLDTILNSETASDEQKTIAQAKFDKEEAKLLKEKEKREKQAFLVSQGIALAEIAINLARTISAITLMAALLPANALTLGASGAAYIATNVPIAVGTAALQAGLVIAQTIPAFKYGKGVNNDYEGLSLLNDGGKDEVRVNEHGQAEVLKGRNIIAPVAKNDMIIPSVSTFNRQMKDPSSDLYQRVSSKLNADTTQRQNMVVVNTKTDTKGIESAIASAFAKQKRPVYNNKVIIKQPRRTSY